MTVTRARAPSELSPRTKAAVAMTNDDRRGILLAQHKHLRQTIDATQRVARGLLSKRSSVARLRAAIVDLAAELEAHLVEEEALLEPILATIDAWGPVRLDLLRVEHAHQRSVLAILTGPVALPAATLVAGRTLLLCSDVLSDMDTEERELLDERVLRDDFVLLDASDC